MGDRTCFQAYIYACPENQRAALQAAVNDWLGYDDEPLKLDEPYTVQETPLGSGKELAAALQQAAPGASWYMWEDPAPSGDGPLIGEMHAYTPELGPYGPQDCNGTGEVVFTLAEVAKAIDGVIQQGAKMPLNSSAISVALHRAMGGQWKEDWEAHRNG